MRLIHLIANDFTDVLTERHVSRITRSIMLRAGELLAWQYLKVLETKFKSLQPDTLGDLLATE